MNLKKLLSSLFFTSAMIGSTTALANDGQSTDSNPGSAGGGADVVSQASGGSTGGGADTSGSDEVYGDEKDDEDEKGDEDEQS